jgi:hypothetical protein
MRYTVDLYDARRREGIERDVARLSDAKELATEAMRAGTATQAVVRDAAGRLMLRLPRAWEQRRNT